MITYVIIGLAVLVFALGIRIVRPVEEGLIERLGKYKRTAQQGFHWIIPVIDQMHKVNITERMVDIDGQMVITKDKLNAQVDAVVYYQIKDTKKALYNVDEYDLQLSSLAQTTLRAVIGKMTLTQANENRAEINIQLFKVLGHEARDYGVSVLRCELQRIDPPQDVQVAMNKVVKAEQEKIAAKDLATAFETKADGEKRAEIKRAEGQARAILLKAQADADATVAVAEGQAVAIKLINTSADKYFKGNAQTLKKLEVAESSFKKATKFVMPKGSEIVNIISDAAGVTPLPRKR